MISRTLLAVILFASLGYSYVAGDGGATFARDTSAQMCAGEGVQAVYVCTGNVVRVVSSVPKEGSTFYKSDGRAIVCPVAEPKDIGAECMELLMPNFCAQEPVCGNSTASNQIFPAAPNSAEQTGNYSYYIVDDLPATEPAPSEPAQNSAPVNTESLASSIKNEMSVHSSVAGAKFDSIMSYLAYVVLFLGIVSVSLLFMMFRNSIADEDLA